jgi:hypothetical protein
MPRRGGYKKWKRKEGKCKRNWKPGEIKMQM